MQLALGLKPIFIRLMYVVSVSLYEFLYSFVYLGYRLFPFKDLGMINIAECRCKSC